MSTEKCCDNCKYLQFPMFRNPCNICIDNNKWELLYTPAKQYAPELLEALKNLLNAEQCPNCNNIGFYQISDSDMEQCQWCYTVKNSLFNRKNESFQLIAKAEGRENGRA